MNDMARTVQEHVLNLARQGGIAATLFLLKGVRLQGQISGFDAYSLTLRRDGSEQLVYKQGVSTVLLPELDDIGTLPRPATGDRQDQFLTRRHEREVRIFLTNGIALQGKLVGHDAYALLLAEPRGHQLLFKHAVATVADLADAT